MYAVIFKAKEKAFDKKYFETAKKLRELAFSKYNCKDFVAISEDGLEIAISYWESLEDIKSFKADSQHLVAQKLGQSRWYDGYKIEIVKILKEYNNR